MKTLAKTCQLWKRRSACFALLFLAAWATLQTRPLTAQDERSRAHEMREERARERKASENDRLDRGDDKVTDHDEKLSRQSDSVNEPNEKLARELKARENDRLKDDRSQHESGWTTDETSRREKNFRSEQLQEQHYEKHVEGKGKYATKEFGEKGITREEYLRQAKELRDTPADEQNIKQINRSDAVNKYDTRTNSFGSYAKDGTIKTYFRPQNGEQYFHEQAESRNARNID